MSLPKFLQSALWSYDIEKMDIKADKELIIQQVLNWGTMKEVKWLFRTYNLKEIKNAIKNPSRGMWDPRVLSYWTKIFKTNIRPIIYEMAIRDLNPKPEKWIKWFNFIKKNASKDTLRTWRELNLLKIPK